MALSLDDINAACRQARRAGATPKLTVGVIPSVAICWLIPRLAEFRELAPSIDLRIVYAVHGREIDFRDVDVAIVYASEAPDLPAIEAAQFLPGASAPVSSRSFVDAHHPLATARDFVDAGLLHDTDHIGWETWLSEAGEPGLPVSAGPVFEDFNLLRAAALSGQGVAICPIAIIRDDIKAGRLVQLSDRTILDRYMYFIVSKRSHEGPTTRALTVFREWLLSTTGAPLSTSRRVRGAKDTMGRRIATDALAE